VHPYGAAYPEAAVAFYDEVRRRIALHAPDRDIPIVVSEWGYAVEGLGREKQAEYLLRALNTNRSSGIPLTIWYNWQEPISPWHSFGLLDIRGRPKAAYDALADHHRNETDRRDRQGRLPDDRDGNSDLGRPQRLERLRQNLAGVDSTTISGGIRAETDTARRRSVPRNRDRPCHTGADQQ
jgi:hypothetical protein